MKFHDLQDAGRTALHLTLSYKPLGLISARVTDMLDDFIAVDTGCITLSANSEIDVMFNAADRGLHRFRARVVGSQSNHTLLQIGDGGGNARRELHLAHQ